VFVQQMRFITEIAHALLMNPCQLKYQKVTACTSTDMQLIVWFSKPREELHIDTKSTIISND
jgi:hypothetical protein